MTGHFVQSEERLLQLLADYATEGLDEPATLEMNERLSSHSQYEASYFEPAAAAIDLATLNTPVAPLPDRLRDKVLTGAAQFFADNANTQPERPPDSDSRIAAFDPVIGQRRASRAGWYLAAASLGLAIAGWWQVFSMGPASTPDPVQQYAEFVRQADDLVRASWAGKEPGYEGVSGDVVWSDANQTGFMRLVNMPPNDPELAQYQLWVVDPDRDSHPVDGGVFDVLATGEVVVPIDVKLEVNDPRVFAITLEKSGGVVVSGGPLLVVGAVAG